MRGMCLRFVNIHVHVHIRDNFCILTLKIIIAFCLFVAYWTQFENGGSK